MILHNHFVELKKKAVVILVFNNLGISSIVRNDGVGRKDPDAELSMNKKDLFHN